MKAWIESAAALTAALVLGGSGSALACFVDTDCACGEVCSWQPPNNMVHVCVDASTKDPGWCDTNAQCLYVGQTCKVTSCTPAWSDTSVCKNAPQDAGPADQDAGPDEDAGSSSSGTTSGTAAGGGTSSGTAAGGGTTSGTAAGAGTSSGTAAGAGSNTGTTGGAGTTGGGTTGGGTGTSCTNDIDCDCGQVCSWQGPNAVNHICVSAASGDQGWCSGSASDCLYSGQTCVGVACSPGWSSSSVCVKGGGTTGGTGPSCQDDSNCTCGQVCSWAHASNDCSSDCGNCLDASSGDVGHCSGNQDLHGCLYVGQGCVGEFCSPAWTQESTCIGQTGGTTGGGTTSGGGNGGGTTGGSTTGGGGPTSCENDIDCACGQVCSWVGPNAVNHICVDASSGDPGWCDGSNSDCLYENQTCSGTACTPPWSSSSICTKSQGTTGGAGTTGAAASTGGTTTGTGTAPSSGGGGCSSAGGSFALAIGVLALGLLTRKRRADPRN